MSRAPQISVLLPVYNGGPFLAEAVHSILRQTEADFELLIIDDGSTDSSVEQALSIGDGRIRVISHPSNLGVATRLNQGLDLARGAYVARMDADDISHPDRLAIQLRYLQAHPEVGICGSWFLVRKLDGSESEVRLPQDHLSIGARLLFRSCLGHPSVMFNLDLLRRNKLRYSPTSPHAEDYDLWVRAHPRVSMVNLSEFLLTYRLHRTQVSRSFRKEQKASADLVRACALTSQGIAYTEADLRIHCRIASGGEPEDEKMLRAGMEWLQRLRRSRGWLGGRARAMRRECDRQGEVFRKKLRSMPADSR